MGEMADAFLNGDFDEETGEWLGEGPGYPRRLSDHSTRPARPKRGQKPNVYPHKCDRCARSFQLAHALMQHSRDRHGVRPRGSRPTPATPE